MITKVIITLLYNWDVYQRRIKQVTAIAVRDSRSFLLLNLHVVTLVRGTTYGSLEDPKVGLNKISVIVGLPVIEAKEKDQVDAILKILVGAEPENLFSSILIGLVLVSVTGAKAKPLKQPKAQHKEYDETDLANLQKKKRETLC
ncbi:hypothetical protein C5167_000557 [Papaver somniferum]|uniref:Uncharacterized protein n=1 Tax=Papaver somniferum TaxID=3469 RepID=A0A4Y7KW47_PAPSO|nr:hypothetical protein C5167_000557 [Papaver somniferum]